MNKDKILEKYASERTKCVVYTRVMGYHRPVESFNLGKKGEHKERVKFCEKCQLLVSFILLCVAILLFASLRWVMGKFHLQTYRAQLCDFAKFVLKA